MRKSQTTAFYFYFFIQENLYFVIKHIWKNLVYIVTFALQFFHVAGYFNVVTPTPIQTFIGFVDAILRSKILGNKLGILMQILIVMDYFFYLYISDNNLQFRKKKCINLGNQFHYENCYERDRNISKRFVFIFHHSIQHESSGYTFHKEKKALAREYFWFTPCK